MTRKAASAGRNSSAVSHGLSSRIMSDSKTPMPPGTWLTSATICAARKAPRKYEYSGRGSGSSTKSTAAARPQSSADSTYCAAISGALGNAISTVPTRTGRFQTSGANAYAAAITARTMPAPRVIAGVAKLAAADRTEEQAPRAEHDQAQPERARVEDDDARQVLPAQAPARVEAVARRRAREQREADVVRDRVADERRHRDLPLRHRPADVDERELIVAGEDGVVDDRERDGEEQREGRQRADRGGEPVQREMAHLPAEHPQGGREQQQADERGESMPEAAHEVAFGSRSRRRLRTRTAILRRDRACPGLRHGRAGTSAASPHSVPWLTAGLRAEAYGSRLTADGSRLTAHG